MITRITVMNRRRAVGVRDDSASQTLGGNAAAATAQLAQVVRMTEGKMVAEALSRRRDG